MDDPEVRSAKFIREHFLTTIFCLVPLLQQAEVDIARIQQFYHPLGIADEQDGS